MLPSWVCKYLFQRGWRGLKGLPEAHVQGKNRRPAWPDGALSLKGSRKQEEKRQKIKQNPQNLLSWGWVGSKHGEGNWAITVCLPLTLTMLWGRYQRRRLREVKETGPNHTDKERQSWLWNSEWLSSLKTSSQTSCSDFRTSIYIGHAATPTLSGLFPLMQKDPCLLYHKNYVCKCIYIWLSSFAIHLQLSRHWLSTYTPI